MKLELKNVKFYESMSEETNCFQADLFINSKKIAYVKNTGQGGCTDYYAIDSTIAKEIMRNAEQHFLSLPEEKHEEYDFNYQPTLENRIDDLFEEWLRVKEDKKFAKQMEKGLLYGMNKMYSYYIQPFNAPIKAMLMTDKGREVLRNKILEIKENGNSIFNTNIPQELFN